MRAGSLTVLTGSFAALFVTVTGIAGIVLYASTHAALVDLAKTRIASVSASIAPDDAAVAAGQVAARIVDLSDDRDTGDLGMVLLDRKGRQIAGNIRLARPLPIGFSVLSAADGIPGLTGGRALVRALPHGLRLIVIAETEPFDGYRTARTRLYAAAFGAILVVGMAGLALFGMLVARRIAAMRRTVDAIVDGDMTRRVPMLGTRDAFDQQAAGFNRMLDRIGELMEEVRGVSNDLAHELRTPLARLRHELASTAQEASAGPVREGIERAIGEVDGLLAVSTAMMRIAEIDSGRRRAGFATLDLARLASDAVEALIPVAEESGHRLTLAPHERVDIRGDRQLLIQMIVNLIENGLRHTPPGTSIEVSLTGMVDQVRLTVSDTGPGIAATMRDDVMRRFARGPGGARHEGHGLGLPLVAAIARLHGGKTLLEDATPGLRVTVTLAQS